MKLQDHKTSETPTLMIIPMIDIIFFLLVFFSDVDAEHGDAEDDPGEAPGRRDRRVSTARSQCRSRIKADGSIL